MPWPGTRHREAKCDRCLSRGQSLSARDHDRAALARPLRWAESRKEDVMNRLFTILLIAVLTPILSKVVVSRVKDVSTQIITATSGSAPGVGAD